MANYCSAIRTNYFHVKDDTKFLDFMDHILCTEDHIEVWTKVDSNGDAIYGFGCYGGIVGYCDDNDDADDASYDIFLDGLQQYVADDDAILIFESGHEKLRYVIGSVQVITSREIDYADIRDIGHNLARKMLDNVLWTSRCEY